MVDPLSRISSLAAASLNAAPEAVDRDAKPLLLRLNPSQRAGVILSIVGIVLAGLALMSLVWLAGRYARRMARQPVRPTEDRSDDWYRKPLNAPLASDGDDDEPT
jgi:cytochrome c-type biogenesis protein CcmH/NrfG